MTLVGTLPGDCSAIVSTFPIKPKWKIYQTSGKIKPLVLFGLAVIRARTTEAVRTGWCQMICNKYCSLGLVLNFRIQPRITPWTLRYGLQRETPTLI